MLPFFYKFPETIGRIFSPKNLVWHALAIALTAIIVKTDFDWTYYQHTHSGITPFLGESAGLIGFVVPVALPLILLAIGWIRKNPKILNAGYAIGQSALLGWLVSSAYKAFTGRAHPDYYAVIRGLLTDNSQIFHFGFWQGGIFWGWPSSHTTVAFAVASTAFILAPNRATRAIAVLFAAFIGIAVSMTFHWLSDAVAGAIIGTVVGLAVGKAFRTREL